MICATFLQLILLAIPANPNQDAAAPQTAPAAVPDGEFSSEQLEQIVAPIALYTDALLTQTLMASTYPLEIVEAARWSEKNPKLTGDKLEAAIKEKTWDPSVKSLCGFPSVLKQMNENLDWTQDMGDAFLGQQAALMDAVQTMRRKAYEAGNLKTGKEQTVTEQADKLIVIVETDPQVVYVPTYYPVSVYGGWGYPYWYYPPMYRPVPVGGIMFGFTVGVIWGNAMWGGCHWGHGNTNININVNNYNSFVKNTEIDARRNQVNNKVGTDGGWQHNAEHRKGVAYKDNKVAQKYGSGAGQARVSRDQARGFEDAKGKPGGAGAGDRAGAGTRDLPSKPAGGAAQPAARPAATPSALPARGNTGQRTGSFSGSGSPSMDKASSSRGSASRGSAGARGASAGGASRGHR